MTLGWEGLKDPDTVNIFKYICGAHFLSYIENERLTAKYCQILKQSYD